MVIIQATSYYKSNPVYNIESCKQEAANVMNKLQTKL